MRERIIISCMAAFLMLGYIPASGELWGIFNHLNDKELGVERESQTRKRKNTEKKKTTDNKGKSTGNKGKVTSGSKNQTGKPQTSAEARKRQEAAQKEIQQTEARLKENEAKVSRSLAEIGKLDQQICKTQGQINDLNRQLSVLNKDIKTLESNIQRNETELTRLREEYLKAVKKMRVTKKNKSTLAFIFSSKSVNQAMRRMRYLREFSSWRDRQSEEINVTISTLKNERESLALARDEQNKALTKQKSSEQELSVQKKKQEVLVADLKKNGAALESHLKKKQAEARELGNMVSQLIAEEQRKAEEEARKRALAEEEARRREMAEEEARKQEEKRGVQGSLADIGKEGKDTKTTKDKEKAPTDYADARKRAPRGKKTSEEEKNKLSGQTGGFETMKGKLPIPSTGSFTITSRFGRQHLPDLPDVEFDNPGIDAETDLGASARAVYEGKVSGVYLLPGYNTVVIVNHGGYYTVYGNISQPAVKIGDNVESGSMLGKLTASEDDENHSSIHFEVWKNREKLNPQEWLR